MNTPDRCVLAECTQEPLGRQRISNATVAETSDLDYAEASRSHRLVDTRSDVQQSELNCFILSLKILRQAKYLIIPFVYNILLF